MIEICDWRVEEAGIRHVRHTVFTLEQGIDSALDFDGRDADCVHALARDDERNAVGTARLQPEGKIGRIAVLPAHRSRGLGRALTRALIGAAEARGLDEVYLHSQVRVAGFYAGMGFRTQGEPFMEAGIEHIKMALSLRASRAPR